MDTTQQRLLVLEGEIRKSRRFNHLLIVAVVAVAGLAGARRSTPDGPPSTAQGQSQADGKSPEDAGELPQGKQVRTIEAEQFVLLDQQGRCGARMSVTDGGPAIEMFDEEGKKRLALGHTNTASGLRLFDTSGLPIVSLQVPYGAEPARLEIRSAKASSLTKAEGFSVRDADEQGRLLLSLINGNFPMLGISQKGQKGPPSIEMTASGAARSLKLHAADGQSLFTLHSTDDGKTTLSMHHPNHERSLQISAGPKESDGPAISLFAPARQDGTGGILPRLRLGLNDDGKPYVRSVDDEGRISPAASGR